MNCIGRNKGVGVLCPAIGNNVELGIGSMVIGDVQIENNTLIGANALVIKSPKQSNCVLVGTPAYVSRKL